MLTSENAAGIGPTIDFDGRLVQLDLLRRGDYAACTAHLRSILPDPMAGLNEQIKDLHPEAQKAVALQAYEDRKNLGRLGSVEGVAYFTSQEGWAFMLWRATRHVAPDITHEQMVAWVKKQDEEYVAELLKLLTRMSGADTEDPSKNSPSQPKNQARSRLTGNGSTGTSRSGIHGRRRKR